MATQNSTPAIESFNSDLQRAKERIYDRCGFECINLHLHNESTDYAACSFELDNKKIQHRLSKITPNKVGQFVTIWKRNTEGFTAPYDITDAIDFIIITCKKEDQLGQFIFPVTVLADKGIISKNGNGGKRGIRVYPPWDKPESKQALATQKWQSPFFVSIHSDASIDIDLLRRLFNA